MDKIEEISFLSRLLTTTYTPYKNILSRNIHYNKNIFLIPNRKTSIKFIPYIL